MNGRDHSEDIGVDGVQY